MANHTVHSYDHDLEGLVSSLIDMAKHMKSELNCAIESWVNPDISLVTQVRDLDRQVNHLDSQIEQRATSMLALRQPMGSDLRFIVSAIKIAVVLERMGDLAKHVVSRACTYPVQMSQEVNQDLIEIMKKIQDQVVLMLELLKLLYSTSDTCSGSTFQKICAADDEIDIMFKLLLEKAQNEVIGEVDKNTVQIFTNFIITMKNVERISDCVTKISRICHYIKTGERVGKHQFRNAVQEL